MIVVNKSKKFYKVEKYPFKFLFLIRVSILFFKEFTFFFSHSIHKFITVRTSYLKDGHPT